jgi:pimeloyl-ACP methyl ester carboxylesterase
MWSPQADALEGAGYRVIAPDLRGFGERRLDPVAFSHHRDAEEVINGPAAVVGAYWEALWRSSSRCTGRISSRLSS